MLCNSYKSKNRKQLYYSYLRFCQVIPERFERSTHALEGRCSIQLSYGTILICGAKVVLLFEYAKAFIPFFALVVINRLFLLIKNQVPIHEYSQIITRIDISTTHQNGYPTAKCQAKLSWKLGCRMAHFFLPVSCGL